MVIQVPVTVELIEFYSMLLLVHVVGGGYSP